MLTVAKTVKMTILVKSYKQRHICEIDEKMLNRTLPTISIKIYCEIGLIPKLSLEALKIQATLYSEELLVINGLIKINLNELISAITGNQV